MLQSLVLAASDAVQQECNPLLLNTNLYCDLNVSLHSVCRDKCCGSGHASESRFIGSSNAANAIRKLPGVMPYFNHLCLHHTQSCFRSLKHRICYVKYPLLYNIRTTGFEDPFTPKSQSPFLNDEQNVGDISGGILDPVEDAAVLACSHSRALAVKWKESADCRCLSTGWVRCKNAADVGCTSMGSVFH
jgi:hypothetical protein